MAKRVFPLRNRFLRYNHFSVPKLEHRLAWLKANTSAFRHDVLMRWPRDGTESEIAAFRREEARLSKIWHTEIRMLEKLIQKKRPKP